MRKLEVMGIQIRDHSVRETMRRITMYLNNGACNTMDFITHDVLLKASNDADMKKDIESMDITPAISSDILQAGNITSRSREMEIESNLLLKGMLRKFAKEKRSIFLISPTEPKLHQLLESLCSFNGDLNIIASAAREDVVGGDDTIVNDINGCLPDIVIMNLDSPEAESFIRENKMKLGAQLIIELRDVSFRVTSEGNVKKGGIGELLMSRLFKKAANNYEKSSDVTSAGEGVSKEEPEDTGKIVEIGNPVDD